MVKMNKFLPCCFCGFYHYVKSEQPNSPPSFYHNLLAACDVDALGQGLQRSGIARRADKVAVQVIDVTGEGGRGSVQCVRHCIIYHWHEAECQRPLKVIAPSVIKMINKVIFYQKFGYFYFYCYFCTIKGVSM